MDIFCILYKDDFPFRFNVTFLWQRIKACGAFNTLRYLLSFSWLSSFSFTKMHFMQCISKYGDRFGTAELFVYLWARVQAWAWVWARAWAWVQAWARAWALSFGFKSLRNTTSMAASSLVPACKWTNYVVDSLLISPDSLSRRTFR